MVPTYQSRPSRARLTRRCARLKASFNFDDVEVESVEVVNYHGGQKLLIVRTADDAAPAVLLFTPAEAEERSHRDARQRLGASA
ncbi:hypothetical protein Bpfe_031093 [Biomphalaria pfeifferi]|uniref:Uncharacterized protein n=1 Tax=Biomphalaria pfeifferi TaxID=112525 RepID=A0AAD8ANK8_BIOPF|nr:hypothetical protein Bpfe_031093 [Biomphalaria pfeifferi]